MAVSESRRIDSSRRLCVKYRTFLYILVLIALAQLVIGYLFVNFIGREGRTSEKKTVVVGTIDVDKSDHIHHHAQLSQPNVVHIKANCEITDHLPKSAIQRARTKECKQAIADVTCLALEGKLYPKEVPNMCPRKKSSPASMLGCFREEQRDQDVKAHRIQFADNSPEKCIRHCFLAGFPFAGLQFGRDCWCDRSHSDQGMLPSSNCDSRCPGSGEQTCGGYQASNVWSTQLHDKVFNDARLIDPTSVSEHERIRIVFLLSVNGRAARQVYRLIKAIYHVNHYYYIHVDKRQEYLYRELLPLVGRYHNIRLTPWRMSTIWGGASLLQMHLKALDDLLGMQDWDWDFYINLSESDYPIKANDYLASFLTKYRDQNFVKSFGAVRGAEFIKKQGLEKTFYECDTHMWRLGDRELPAGIILDGGSDWVGLTRDFASYVLTSQDALVSGLKRIYQYTLLPAESIFHTILHNSVFCNQIVNNNLHITNWQRKKGCKCQYKHVVDWCGCSPNVYLSSDFQRILAQQTKPVFFARKFEPVISQDVINKLSEWLYGQYAEDTPGLNSYWENIWHHLDDTVAVGVTYGHAYSRFATNQYSRTNPTCRAVEMTKPLEVTLYQKRDRYQGLLVAFNVRDEESGSEYELEAFIQPESTYHVLNAEDPSSRLIHAQVGSRFDPKELFFRDYANMLGPQSRLELMYSFSQGPKFTLTVMWIDPGNEVAAYFNILINPDKQTAVHKPELHAPLQPGIWTVRLYYQTTFLAYVKFLILPLMFNDQGEHISSQEAEKINAGSRSSYSKREVNLELNLVRISTDSVRHLVGEKLNQYADSVLESFWRFRGICYYGDASPCERLTSCSETEWSSRSPDPKSTLGPINGITGGIRTRMAPPPRIPRRMPPPVPVRRTQPDYNTSMYRTPYSYGTGMYNGYSAYGAPYNRYPISNFVRLAEDSSRPAFESMENIVQAFGSIAMVLESTSFAVQSSFRAVLGLAEHFSRLRVQLTHMISTFTLFRTLRYLYRKLLILLRMRRRDTNENDDVWSDIVSAEGLFTSKGRRRSSWPLMLFFCIVIGGPYIIWRLMASMKEGIVTDSSWMSGDGEHFVAVAEYDYDAENEDELSLNASQDVKVAPKDLQPRIKGWLLASVDGEKSGLVPANYVRIRGRKPARIQARPTFHNQVWSEIEEVPVKNVKLENKTRAETESSSANESGSCSPLPSVDSAIGSDHKNSEVR